MEAHEFVGPVMSDGKAVGKRIVEWDLNDWKWDGDLCRATPLDPPSSGCSRSNQFLPIGSEIPLLDNSSCDENAKRELEKRRRVAVVEHEELNYEQEGFLNLKLGGNVYAVDEGDIKTVKKSKICGASTNGVVCQVEDCRVDLSNAKDYHRRHKVCDVHSKASRALVGKIMQRFCQQCSRFHALQEFDEGKRSCRRRLAGHNKRRRKTHPENVTTGSSLNDGQGSNYLLISLLRILSNIHLNNSDQSKVHDVVSHLMKNLDSLSGPGNEKNQTGHVSQSLLIAGASTETSTKERGSNGHHEAATMSTMREKNVHIDDVRGINIENPSSPLLNIGVGIIAGSTPNTKPGRTRLNDIDLNNAYDDPQNCMENLNSDTLLTKGKVPSTFPIQLCRDPKKSSPPQTSGNSVSTALQSPCSSSGEAQSQTERIVFKLFGKDPKDFPHALRNQILDWLSRSPTEIESYIRPGCIVLTIYLRMEKSMWEELCSDMISHLRRLLNLSTHPFWKTGWVYARVQQNVAFIYDGQVVVGTSLPHVSHSSYRILSIRPIAVPPSETVQFSVRLNFCQSTTRLLCAIEGKYLRQENCTEAVRDAAFIQHNPIQSLSFRCTTPNVNGRGFIEVEDHSLSNTFFPFIVAENDVCMEIRSLESLIEVKGGDVDFQDSKLLISRKQALYFMNEMGWLLHKNQAKLKLEQTDIHFDLFPFERFEWLVEFSLDREWCAVVGKLLSILFNGTVDAGQHSSVELALLEAGLLHRAVKQKSRKMVEFLLRYQQKGVVERLGPEQKQHKGKNCYLFRPDATGPGGLTPLHVAACADGSVDILDALLDDPEMVSIRAWKAVRDNTGMTPFDYASIRGSYMYINVVKEKIKQQPGDGHVILDISAGLEDNSKQKLVDGRLPAKFTSFHIQKGTEQLYVRHCKKCEVKMSYGSGGRTLAMYKPTMLSMVAVAAVCVCVALLFKSSPEVYVFRPFRWENLGYGSI